MHRSLALGMIGRNGKPAVGGANSSGIATTEETAMRTVLCGLTMLGCLLLVAGIRADDEEKVPLDKLPAKVTEAVKAKFEGAKLVSASKEKENDKVVFEVQIEHKGSKIDVTLTPEGSITAIEKTIEAKDLPKPVAEALEAKYPKATYKIVEEITKGETITFEILLVTADKKTLEVTFDPKGKLLEEEKKDKKDDKDEKKEEKKEKKDKDKGN
jgi:hypothetical protein